jgi:hypothetical protein
LKCKRAVEEDSILTHQPHYFFILNQQIMKIFIFTLSMVLPLILYSQQAVLGGGGEASGSGGTMSYSIGQIAYVAKGAGPTASEGVQQAFEVTNLPVELLYFEAKVVGEREVELSWETASELNNDYFTVERSVNARDWEYVTKVMGSGTTSENHSYQLADNNPHLGKSYYRLIQTDYDGTYSYSDIRSVYLKKSLTVSLYPNPTSGKLTIEVEMEAGDEVSLTYELISSGGKVVKEGVLKSSINILNVSNLSVGVYWLRAGDGQSNMISERIIKINK